LTREIDESWFIDQAIDEKSKSKMNEILKLRNFVLKNNKFIENKDEFILNLNKWKISFREDRSFSSIEVFYEIFKENEHYQVEEFRNNNKTIIDLGANEGYFLLKTKEYNPESRVICVEPNPFNFKNLEKNVSINNLEHVELVNAAVDEKSGKMMLDIIEQIGNIGSHDIKSVDRKWMKDEFIKKIQVETISLDSIVSKFKIEKIDLLKIDIEGMEVKILENCKKALNITEKIVVERHSKENKKRLEEILPNFGFKLIHDEDPEFTRYYGDLYFKKIK
jgi:FkbM family methyltransferase